VRALSQRFDELDLHPGTAPLPPLPLSAISQAEAALNSAPRYRRTLALLTDLSLFAALALALSPLVPEYADREALLLREWPSLLAIGGFLVLFSFFYFAGGWLIWGRTVGGTIFDVRIVRAEGTTMDVESAAKRWAGLYLSLFTLGIGFFMAMLPQGRSLADRLSETLAVQN
jgi:uncharacterized RDD family membrane protein YckC